MHLIIGTIPDKSFPLTWGPLEFKDGALLQDGRELPISRGTPALMAAACITAQTLHQQSPVGLLAGDIGTGRGSREIYADVEKQLPTISPRVITFHYLQPILPWHNRVLDAILKLPRRPVLIADAGHMYVAKMSGRASHYDLFTPDTGELAFLADEEAPHPFYTRGFVVQLEQDTAELVRRASRHSNAARYLLIKGHHDIITANGTFRATVKKPVVEAMEAIGGTGDTLTGIASALISAGFDIEKASTIAARANRLAGFYSRPSPATQIKEIITNIPRALHEIMQ